MKTLVTGATGFIGAALVAALTRRGMQVRVLARSPERAVALAPLGVDVAIGDVTDDRAVKAAVAGCDAVFHAAATVNVIAPNREDMLRTNVEGTRIVLEAARREGVSRALHLSSIAAIGGREGDVDEHAWNDGHYSGPYEESKHQAERAALEAGRRGLDVVHVLPSVVIGPGDEKSGAFFRRFLHGGVPAVPRPDGRLNFVYIDDLVDGILLAFDRGKANERYIFNQATWTTTEFLQELANATGRPPPRRVPYAVAYAGAALEEARAVLARSRPRVSRAAVRLATRNTTYSSEKARRELGWSPPPFVGRFRQTIQYWAAEEGVRVPS